MSKDIAASWGAVAPLSFAPGERVLGARCAWAPRLNRAWARSGMMGAVWYPDDDASPFEVSATPVALANRIIPAQPHTSGATGFRALRVQAMGQQVQLNVTATRLDTGATTSASASNASVAFEWFSVDLSLLAGVAYVLTITAQSTLSDGDLLCVAMRERIKIAGELP